MNPLMHALVFLIQTVFGFYLSLILLRLLLQWIRADFYNPLSQFIIKLTKPVIVPLRRAIPSYRNLDLASVVALFLLTALKLILLVLFGGYRFGPVGLLFLIVADILSLMVSLYFFLFIGQFILSWINPHNMIYDTISRLTDPILIPIRRLVPPIAGFDLSIMVAMIALQLANILFIEPLAHMAGGL